MSIRVTALYLLITGLSIYAWRDWFKSLCGLILMMAFMEHGDMPSKLFGIQGLNPWNFLFGMIVLAWAACRRREGLHWDMPRHIGILLLLYLGVILFGVLRAILDRSHLEGYPLNSLISEELINTIKWVLPGVLLFDGCRTRKQVLLALTCILVMYLLIAVQVIQCMPLEAATGHGQSIDLARAKLDRRVGYNACDLSAMLAGVSWGMLAVLPLIRRKLSWPVIFAAAGIVALGQALTGGRAGYVAWGGTGLVMCLLKWRRHLILAPVVLVLLPILLPGAADRMLQGFGRTDTAGEGTVDRYAVTAGRLVAWPRVIDKIGKSPFIGYGQRAMQRTGISNQLMSELNESFPHPHNVYLETLLDNGILGSLPIFFFWGTAIVYSVSLFRSFNPLYSAVGGLSLALILAQLFAGIGAQHYFPKEGTFGLWTTVFLLLRVYVEEMRVRFDAIEFRGGLPSALPVQGGMAGGTYPLMSFDRQDR
jgi:O-antigen ligase